MPILKNKRFLLINIIFKKLTYKLMTFLTYQFIFVYSMLWCSDEAIIYDQTFLVGFVKIYIASEGGYIHETAIELNI